MNFMLRYRMWQLQRLLDGKRTFTMPIWLRRLLCSLLGHQRLDSNDGSMSVCARCCRALSREGTD